MRRVNDSDSQQQLSAQVFQDDTISEERPKTSGGSRRTGQSAWLTEESFSSWADRDSDGGRIERNRNRLSYDDSGFRPYPNRSAPQFPETQ